jgi:DNA-binding transcriptional ArsR family regulator
MESADAEVLEEARTAMREIARELARFFATSGTDARDFDQAFRAELVATLTERLREADVEPTVARLAVMTSLPRSSVEQAISQRVLDRETSRTQFSEQGLVVGLATLTSLWTSDSRFTAVYGVPRDLPVRTQDNNVSLEYLSELAMPGVSFEVVLRSLQDHGLVEIYHDGSLARLRSQTVFFRNLEAQVVSHYGRMVSGLMRNLRINRERRLDASVDKPWNSALVMDRPIAEEAVQAFVDIVADSTDKWIRNLETMEPNYAARPGEDGRRYAVCAFVSPDQDEANPPRALVKIAERHSDRLYQRSLLTSRISHSDVAEFRRYVAESGAALLHSIDAEHKSLLVQPGSKGTRLVVCCYMFDVTGSSESLVQAIDLAEARAQWSRDRLERINARG